MVSDGSTSRVMVLPIISYSVTATIQHNQGGQRDASKFHRRCRCHSDNDAVLAYYDTNAELTRKSLYKNLHGGCILFKIIHCPANTLIRMMLGCIKQGLGDVQKYGV